MEISALPYFMSAFFAQDREEQGRGEGQDELQQLDDGRRRLPASLVGSGTAPGAAAAVGQPAAGRRAVAGLAVLGRGRRRGDPAAEATELLHQRDPRTAAGRRECQHQQEEAGR